MKSRRARSALDSFRGVTALDLVISMAVVAVLVAAAVPAFRHAGLELRMKSAVTLLHADLAAARGEAIRQGARTVACPAGSGGGCATTAQWHLGWLAFRDDNGNFEWQPDEPVLRRAPAMSGIRITGSASRTRLRFFPNGSAPGSNAAITFCDERGAPQARQITLSSSGRIRHRGPGESGAAACPG